MYGDAIGKAMAAAVVVIAALCFAAGGLAVWGLPLLWAWLKPWIHAISA